MMHDLRAVARALGRQLAESDTVLRGRGILSATVRSRCDSIRPHRMDCLSATRPMTGGFVRSRARTLGFTGLAAG
jgi:hypothetical protein